MTDLERAWDDLPVGPAPIDALLLEGRRAAAAHDVPRRRLRGSLGAIAVAGAVAAAFVAGMLVTTSGPAGTGGPGAPLPPGAGVAGGDVAVPMAFSGELSAPASCDDLLAHYVDTGVDLVSAWGWEQPSVFYDLSAAREEVAAQALGVGPTTTRSTSSATGTTVQEAGVDEPDTVKTDGELLVRLRGAVVTTYDVAGPSVRELGELDLGDLDRGEILLAGDTVVVVGDDGSRSQTRVLTVDVGDPATPTVEHTIDYDAASVTARQHGDVVRLVLSAGLPDLGFVGPGRGRGGAEAALRANRAVVEDSAIGDWLPSVSVDGGAARPLLECDQVAVPRAGAALGTMAVVGFDAASADDLDAFGVAGDASLAYESVDHLYLATPGSAAPCLTCRMALDEVARVATGGTTHVYGFALDGTRASYVGAGEVEGTLADRWSMDEYDGVLRLVVGPSSQTGPFSSVVMLTPRDGELAQVGRLDRLGVGEQITAVRWFDTLAIVVTFREVDPLYAIDLTDQSAPRLIGELEIPGFSSYLHPLGSMRMVGVGEGPTDDGRRWGAQAGLFDVTDLTDPRRLDVVSYGAGSRALAGDDPRQLTWLPALRTVLTVVQRGRAVYLSTLRLGDGVLTPTLTRVEYGTDADQVRTLPLPGDGQRVLLVTGEDVRFLEVS